jgi:cysteinyl-tRNA synthetase
MHNGFLRVAGEKMSKSLGNFVTIRELLKDKKFGGREWPGEVLRLAMLMTHYRQSIDWTVESLEEALRTWTDWKRIISQVDVRTIKIEPAQELVKALSDDLNTPEAIRYLHELAKLAHKSPENSEVLYRDLVFLGLIPDHLALAEEGKLEVKKEVQLPDDADADTIAQFKPQIETALNRWVVSLPSSANTTSAVFTTTLLLSVDPGEVRFLNVWKKHNPYYISSSDREYIERIIGIETVNELIETRVAARRVKDFTESDRIRDELKAKGIELEDNKDGTAAWKVVP